MIKEKYPHSNFFDINFIDMKGYDILDPADGSMPTGDLNLGESVQAVPEQLIGKGVPKWKELKGFKE